MLFQDPNVIFVHIPRTAGNWFQHQFLRYSLDEKTVVAWQDGLHRFGLTGRFTKEKHQPLRLYKRLLGDEFSNYDVFATVRHPVSRLLSCYFAPVRHMRRTGENHWELRAPLKFSFDRFERIIHTNASCCEYLNTGPGQTLRQNRTYDYSLYKRQCMRAVEQPNIRVMRYENLSQEIVGFLRQTGFSLDPGEYSQLINRSSNPELKASLEKDSEVIDLVMRSHHKVDVEVFYS